MKRIRWNKKTLSRLLIFAGIVLISGALIFEAYHYPWGTLFGRDDQDEVSIPDPSPIVWENEDRDSVIIRSTPESSPAASAEEPGLLPGDEKAATLPLSVYTQLGILKIPKLNVSEYVLEGTQRQLRYGVGHVEKSGALGQQGNCVVAGHRTTAFRYLNKLAAGDSIILKADDNIYTYTVYESFAVLPKETWVLGNVENEPYTLTLITCTPYLVSSHRLIVRARLADINGMTPEAYYGTASAPPAD
ncbi:Sortase family protein [Sporobacter termitidis DSM 10068]|uniref:Sortase family protein n=2 Tax=Sporobacter TaxID=44748 RepID=A0A1M5YQH2_9FIRM|nr:Sortase family protein [Sporobacter termitidis DSM 10068]